MDSMETNDSEESSKSISKWMTVSKQLWEGIYSFIDSRITNLSDKKVEDSLKNWLASMLNDKTVLKYVFIPPNITNLQDRHKHTKQYTAYTIWIFGALFKMISSDLSSDVILEINKLQCCILRVLSRFNLKDHEIITTKFMEILKLMPEFKDGAKKVIIFNLDDHCIDGLELNSYMVKIRGEKVSFVQVLILQMILQSGLSVWNIELLWKTVSDVFVTSDFEVRDYALAILVEIIKTYPTASSAKQEDIVMSYAEQVLNILPGCDIPNETLMHYAQIFHNMIQMLPNRIMTVQFCLTIIDAIVNGNKIFAKLLEPACYKIRLYLNANKTYCSESEIETFIHYCTVCPEFTHVLIHYMFHEIIRATHRNQTITVSDTTKIWMPLKKVVTSSIMNKKYNSSLIYFKALRLLNCWLQDCDIRAEFFNCDMSALMTALLDDVEADAKNLSAVIFEIWTEMLHFRELRNLNIHKIVALCLPGKEESPETNSTLKTIAKGLSVSVKIKCLQSLLTSPKAVKYVKNLQACVEHEDENIVVAAILCTSSFPQDIKQVVNFASVIQYCIKPAVEKNTARVHEAIASVLGDIICLDSKCGQLVRKSWDTVERIVECKYCDTHKCSESFYETIVQPSTEKMIPQMFPMLLQSEFKEVRRKMSRNLHRFSNHTIVFNNNETTKCWLPYIEDRDESIRSNVANNIHFVLQNKLNMAQVNNIMLESNVPEDLDQFVDLVVEKMLDVLEEVFSHPNPSVHRTLLLTAKNFVSVPFHLTERRILTMFLQTTLHPVTSDTVLDFAIIAFEDVSQELYKLSQEEMWSRYKTDFMELIMNMAVYNYISFSYNLASTLHRTAKCLGYQGSRQFLSKNWKYAVCHLIPHVAKEPSSVELVSDLANLIKMDKPTLIKNSFNLVYTNLQLNEPEEVVESSLKMIESFTGTKINCLIATSFDDGNLFPLILRLSENPEKVIKYLRLIFEVKGYGKSPENPQKYVVNNIASSLHGILVSLDRTLRLKYDEYMQKSALASLASFINLMGVTHIKKFRYMILIILRTATGLKWPGSKKLCCDAFNAFIRNVAVEDLGPLLPIICISMVPLIEHCPRESNEVFDFLIIKNEKALSTYISELFFVDDLKISCYISDVIKKHVRNAKPRQVCKNLEMWLKRVKHETEEIRLKAFVHLQVFLSNHRNEINELIVGDIVVHSIIVELMDVLLAGCQDKQESIRLASAECIGELGAVEPRIFPRRILTRNDIKFISGIDINFACAALEELIRSLQSQKGSESNIFSLAIQEILKTFRISPAEPKNVWFKFDPTMQQMITPFLSSHYSLPSDQTEFPDTVYGTDGGSTYESWTYNWVCSMSKKVKNATLKQMLANCRLAFKQDIKIANFAMPHIVVEIILQGSASDCSKLLEEMFAVIKINKQSTIDQQLLNFCPIRSESNVISKDTRVSDEIRRIRCSQTVFHIVDHLQRWLQEKRLQKDDKFLAVQSFCNKLDFLALAVGAYQACEYHRALLYLEHHITVNDKPLSESERLLLAKIYTQLEEPDGVAGILATLEQYPTLQQQILSHEVTGQLQDAASCYEILVKNDAANTKYLQGMTQCYLELNQPFTAMNFSEGILKNRPELKPLINDSEPFWKLAHYGMLDDLSGQSVKNTILNDLKNGIKPDLFSVKKKLISLLRSSTHPGAYQESYSAVMKLHTLNEFEKVITIMLDNVENVPKIFEEWEKRGQLVRARRGQEFLLSMRRMSLDLALKLYVEKKGTVDSTLKQEIGKLWLKSASIARKAGLYQQAYGYILSASESCAPQDLYIEQAQLYWEKGSNDEAIATLKRCLSKCFKPTSYYEQLSQHEHIEERKKCAKAKLYYAKYNDKTVSVEISSNLQNYDDALNVWKSWEKSWVAVAEYNESVFEKLNELDKDSNGRVFQENMIANYGKSLQFGCKYINQSMPRMLTTWIDYATRLNQIRNPDEGRVETLVKMTRNIETFLERLPAFMWYTAFSQLVSRIGHPSAVVQRTLSSILVKVILSYPQQSLWMMASVINSSFRVITNVCNAILNDAKLRDITTLIRDFNRLWQMILDLSKKTVSQGVYLIKVSNLCPRLPRLLSSSDFSAIMMPITKFLQLQLPANGESLAHHNVFPMTWHQITGIDDEVTIMRSMQRPRKITLMGADGKSYSFICKYKDDLRKDCRFMEMDHIVNKCLQNNPESCQRRLYIRTYSVIPLNEECGLIEWVPNLLGFRPIIMNLYKEKGHRITVKNALIEKNDPLAKKRKVFLETYLPSYPAVFGDWFRINFPDAYGWSEARTAYIRTSAVMSMVGYVMGLGDRHGENINLDSTNGDCVHVDFNYLFNGGEKLPWPERVPFRLTQNMIHAMGPLKLEGPFRKTCETTLRVLRENSRTLVSVLIPFVYDPMLKWSKYYTEGSEMTNTSAVNDIKQIELRLKGLICSQLNVPLNFSVEGQTNYLILEATNVDNLCQMFFGWGAFL